MQLIQKERYNIEKDTPSIKLTAREVFHYSLLT